MPETKSVQARVEGRVQGVSFRAWTQLEAQVRELTGWVRNEADGSVTTVLAGPEAAVNEMLKELQHGPPAAVVHDVRVEDAGWPEGGGFHILR